MTVPAAANRTGRRRSRSFDEAFGVEGCFDLPGRFAAPVFVPVVLDLLWKLRLRFHVDALWTLTSVGFWTPGLTMRCLPVGLFEGSNGGMLTAFPVSADS